MSQRQRSEAGGPAVKESDDARSGSAERSAKRTHDPEIFKASRRYKVAVGDSYITPAGKRIDAKRPWFRVAGDKSVYRFRAFWMQGERTLISADGPNGFRVFNVGKPYRHHGCKVPQYFVRPAGEPKGSDR